MSVRTYAMDLADSKNVDRLAAECPEIDILVNNAGAIPRGTIAEIDETRWREAWDLKVFGYINMTRRFYALMAARKKGVIINIIGAAGERGAVELCLRLDRQRLADGVFARARRHRAERRAPGCRSQPGPGGDRPDGDAAAARGDGEIR